VEKKLNKIQSKHDKLLKKLTKSQQQEMQKIQQDEISELSSIVVHEEDGILSGGNLTNVRRSVVSSARSCRSHLSAISDFTSTWPTIQNGSMRTTSTRRQENSHLTERLQRAEEELKAMKGLVEKLTEHIATYGARIDPSDTTTIQLLRLMGKDAPANLGKPRPFKKLSRMLVQDYANRSLCAFG